MSSSRSPIWRTSGGLQLHPPGPRSAAWEAAVNTSEFLKALTEASGVSGYEHAVRDIVCAEFASLCDGSAPMHGQRLRESTRFPGGKRIMLAGHGRDRPGRQADRGPRPAVHPDQGLRRPSSWAAGVGAWPRTMPGVIGMRPPTSSRPAAQQGAPMEDLFVDLGLAAGDRQVRARGRHHHSEAGLRRAEERLRLPRPWTTGPG